MICFLLGILVAVLPDGGAAQELKPFTSDGCSAFPDGTPLQKTLWLKCCREHDYAYWKGGTYQERLDADLALKECVKGVGKREVALLMLSGVRVGGAPLMPTPFRWGYGWSFPRYYGELTEEELKQVEKMKGEAEKIKDEASTSQASSVVESSTIR